MREQIAVEHDAVTQGLKRLWAVESGDAQHVEKGLHIRLAGAREATFGCPESGCPCRLHEHVPLAGHLRDGFSASHRSRPAACALRGPRRRNGGRALGRSTSLLPTALRRLHQLACCGLRGIARPGPGAHAPDHQPRCGARTAAPTLEGLKHPDFGEKSFDERRDFFSFTRDLGGVPAGGHAEGTLPSAGTCYGPKSGVATCSDRRRYREPP